MKIKTNRLKDKALDWAVAKALGALGIRLHTHIGRDPGPPVWVIDWENGWEYLDNYTPSADWALGGPIIDREKLSVGLCHPRPSWATRDTWFAHENRTDERPSRMLYGPTALITAMRCYVASKLGDEVDIPEELL